MTPHSYHLSNLSLIALETMWLLVLTDKEITLYEREQACQICKGSFCYDKNKKREYALYHRVRDHCHYTEKFRGAAHNICNLR